MTQSTELDLLKSIFNDITLWVEDRKRSIDQEIGEYPMPVPACDAQFNYLLEQRSMLSQQLNRLRTPARDNLVLSEYVDLIRGFLNEIGDPGGAGYA